jgi:hypothetical protein
MEAIPATAALVGADEPNAGNGASVRLARQEIEEALALTEPPELALTATAADGRQHELSVAWTRADLERLLASDGPEIELLFDTDELESALDEDVELHDLRRPALVLTVALVGAAAASSAATAATPADSPNAKRFHGIELTAKRFHGVEPDAKRFHGVKPDAKRFHGVKPQGGARWG